MPGNPLRGRKKKTNAPAGEVAVDPAAAVAEEQIEDEEYVAPLDVDVEGLPRDVLLRAQYRRWRLQ